MSTKGLNRAEESANLPKKESSQAELLLQKWRKGLTPALPRWRELSWHVQFWSVNGKEEVDDDHDDDGDDDGKVWDVGAEDGGKEALAFEAFEGGGNEVGPDEQQATHEKDIGHVVATWGQSWFAYFLCTSKKEDVETLKKTSE